MAQGIQTLRGSWRRYVQAAYVLLLVIGLAVAVVFQGVWFPALHSLWSGSNGIAAPGHEHGKNGAADDHGHDHSHAGHDEANSIELSDQARKNIGLKLEQVALQPFVRTVSIPGIVVERPSQSTAQVTAPLTGVVTAIHTVQGAAVSPGEPLFEVRLTHEELVQSQSELLKSAEQLDVINREIKRLEAISMDGAIARKTILERKYEQQKQQAELRSQTQALLLHGFSQAQVDTILQERKLLSTLTVYAPQRPASEEGTALYQVQSLNVAPGQHVEIGATLAVLSDHAELFIEGNAFERDLPAVSRAASEDAAVVALIEAESASQRAVEDLRILYVAGQVDAQSRTLHFYVRLPNELIRNEQLASGHRYISWRFRPGQRVHIQVPVETWKNRIVLPIDAIAQDGVETYVFTPNGDHFDRQPVHVEYRDSQSAIIAPDGALLPGTWVATSGAQQLQIALKNKSGGGVDPHAGHSH